MLPSNYNIIEERNEKGTRGVSTLAGRYVVRSKWVYCSTFIYGTIVIKKLNRLVNKDMNLLQIEL